MKYLATLFLIFGFGLSASAQTIKSLGYNTTNGQVVYGGTNALTFTNRFTQSSTNATNPPEFRLVTKSNAVASWFYYDAFGAGGANTTNDVDWSVLWLGNNHVASSSGLDFGRADQSIGAISLTMENMYYAGSLPSPSHVGEFYINISDYTTNGSGTTRAMFVVGSQTNSTRGQVSFSYPIYLNYNQQAVDWLSTGSGLGGLNVGTTNSFQLATFYNTGTAHGGAARISIGAPANAMGIEAGPNYGYIRQFSAGRTAFRISTNGVIYGATNNSDTAQAPIHLAGDTRIDGTMLLKSLNTTNIPTLFWQTSDGVGDGAMLAFSRRHATNLWFGINQTNWSQGVWGQNIQPTSDGNNFTRKNTNFGSVALVLENEYNAEQNTNHPPLNVAEMYFDVTDTSGQRIRPLMFVGSQTNSALGWGYSVYPLTVGITNLGWNAASAFQVDYNNPSGGGTMVLKNLSTSGGSYAELQMVSGGGTALILQKQNRFDLYANNVSYGYIIQALTNGVVIGSSSFKSVADARVQLGGDTRIDGAISFNATSNAATTRTNLGLGGGITATNTFVSYNGTNYTTNTVTISNGIVTGWTQ